MDPKHILLLTPTVASDETNSVIYLLGSRSKTQVEALRLNGERVMTVGWEKSASAPRPV